MMFALVLLRSVLVAVVVATPLVLVEAAEERLASIEAKILRMACLKYCTKHYTQIASNNISSMVRNNSWNTC